jgi:hypothetical protein
MLSNPEYLRELTVNQIFNDEKSDEPVVHSFVKYIDAYCAELKCTEHDILLDDEKYVEVFGIFSNIMAIKD